MSITPPTFVPTAWPSASDPQVIAKAATEGLTLITADRGDFGRELALTRAVEPSVVVLQQLPDVVRAADVAALLLCQPDTCCGVGARHRGVRRAHPEISSRSAPPAALNPGAT